MTRAFERLQQRFRQRDRFDHAVSFLSWDQRVMMPPAGGSARADALAELASHRHGLLVDPVLADWFAVAADEVQSADADGQGRDARRSLAEMHRRWQQATAVPDHLVRAQVLASARCEQGWREQRAANDWAGFLVNFREVLALSREEADCRQAARPDRFATRYDSLLDRYCTGDSQALIERVFGELAMALPALLDRLRGAPDSGAASLPGHYPRPAQAQLARRVLDMLGFDFSAGRLDESAHPFSTGDRGDQRITTRYRSDEFLDALQSTAHEAGHAAYEAGRPAEQAGLPIGEARNMCIHESQSVLFERHVLQSPSFMQALLPAVRECLADASALDIDTLRQAWHRVEPGLIRVEADEVTYPLHVLLRHDIEQALINGDLEAEQVPDAWDERMQHYFGISTAGNMRDGCLQDIHWADGAFGYFPSYTIGAVNAAQLMDSIRSAHPDWQQQLADGRVGFIRDWLGERVWQRASSVDSQVLMQEATGSGTDAGYLLRHLESRYVDGNR